MKYFLQSIILFCLLVSASSNAAISTFFFDTDQGERVRVDISGSTGDPSYTIYANDGQDSYELFRQYVKSTLAKRNYYLVKDRGGCRGCEEPLISAENDGALVTENYGTLGGMKKKRIFSDSDIANKVIESASNQIGSRLVDAVANKLSATTVTNSPFTIITGDNGSPRFMCRPVSGHCKILDDVLFIDKSNGFSVSHPAHEYGKNYQHIRNVENTLHNFISQFNYTCVSTYTNSGNGPVLQTVCFHAAWR